jgi:RND family efflux transporter MFP subunit
MLAGAASAFAIVAYRPTLQSQPVKVVSPLVTVIQVKPEALRLNVYSQGMVVPRTEIDWVAEVAGKVIRIHPNFFTGGFFRVGEELLAIDSRDYDQAIAAARARIAEAKRQVAQEEAHAEQARNEWQALGEGQPSPLTLHEPQLAEARAKLKASEADLARAHLQRSRCTLYAPFTGRVLSRYVGLGQYVQPGGKLARLYSTDVAEVRLPVTIDQLAYLDLSLRRLNGHPELGPKVIFTANIGEVEQHWQGRIVRSEAQVDKATGLLYLIAEIREPYSKKYPQPMLAGLFVKAEIEGRVQDKLFALPPEAVNPSQEAMLVDVSQRLHIQQLKVLRNEPDRILVKDGLAAGDRVVVSGVKVPVEGMRVRLKNSGGGLRTAIRERPGTEGKRGE